MNHCQVFICQERARSNYCILLFSVWTQQRFCAWLKHREKHIETPERRFARMMYMIPAWCVVKLAPLSRVSQQQHWLALSMQYEKVRLNTEHALVTIRERVHYHKLNERFSEKFCAHQSSQIRTQHTPYCKSLVPYQSSSTASTPIVHGCFKKPTPTTHIETTLCCRSHHHNADLTATLSNRHGYGARRYIT